MDVAGFLGIAKPHTWCGTGDERRGHAIAIHVLDAREEGPTFGARALLALTAPGEPLHGIELEFQHHAYDWTDTAEDSASTESSKNSQATVWQPGVSAYDWVSPIVQTGGLRLWCDESRDWHLDLSTTTNETFVSLSSGSNESGDNGNGGENGDRGNDGNDGMQCSTADLTPGTIVQSATLDVTPAGSFWNELELDA